MVGQYSLGVSICAPVFVLAGLNLRFVQATDAGNEYSFNHYWGLRLITSFLAILTVSLIVIFMGYRLELAVIVLLLGVFKSLEALSDTIYGFLQRREQMDFIGISLIVKSLLSVFLLIISLSFSKNLFWAVSSLVAASALTLIWYDSFRCGRILADPVPARRSFIDIARALRPYWGKPEQLKLVRISLPLGLVGMLLTLTFNIPRYFIEHHWGAKPLGIYSAMFQLLLAGSIVMMAIGQSLQPRLAIYYAGGQLGAFRHILVKAAAFAGLLGGLGFLFAILWGKQLLTVFYSSEYARHAHCFQMVMMASIFYYIATILLFGLSAMRAFKKLLLPFSASVIIAALSSWHLIPRFGIEGAALSLFIINVFNSLSLLLLLASLLSKASCKVEFSQENGKWNTLSRSF